MGEISYTQLSSDIAIMKKKKLEEKKELMSYKNEDGFWEFCKYLYPHFFNDSQTERIRYARVLNNCGGWTLTGDEKYAKYKKVMINVFPRFGKSFMLSIFSVWLLWQFPKGSIMRNAHDATLAEKFSRDVRNIIETQKRDEDELTNINTPANKLRAIAPKLTLSKDKRALNMWALESSKDVAYFCAGVKGAITGNGCDLAMILDDPVKDPEKAMSASFADELLDWYLTVHRSRQDRDSRAFGCEIIVMARWSDDDLCSKLMEAEDDWYLVYFDAEDEEGNSACESIFPTEKLKSMKQGFINTGRLKWWNALYRQKVEDIGKKLFRHDKILRYDNNEFKYDSRRHQRIAYCDTADEGSDSLSCPFGYFDLMTGDIYIEDVIFSKSESEVLIPIMAQKIIDFKPEIIVFESNNGGKYYGELVRQSIVSMFDTVAIGENKVDDINFEYKRTSANKETKILVYSSLVMAKCYFLEKHLYEKGSNYGLFISELCSHQKERKNIHDDAPDSITSMAKRFCGNGGIEIC